MLVTKYIEIDMGHRVPNHKSKCRNLHGHRYKIEVGVDDKVIATPGTSDEGMVIDFSDLKQIMIEEIDAKYDHNSVFYGKDITFTQPDVRIAIEKDQTKKIIYLDSPPTAEKLAEHWYNIIKPRLEEKKIRIKFVRVWETPTSTATYEE